MAMIKCPNCGGDISDKATNCIFCNYNIASHTQKLCVECGNIIELNSSICNKCGCPVNSNHQRQLVSDNNTEKTSDKGSLKKIVIGFSAVCVVLFIGIGIKMATDNNTNNPTIKVESSNSIIEYTTSNESNEQPSSTIESKSVPEESTNSSEDLDLLEYKIDYINAVQLILDGAQISEDCCYKISCVWRNSIWEEHDDETDKYTFDGTNFFDFNSALDNLFNDSDFSSKIDSLNDNKNSVMNAVKKLKKAPDEMKEANELLNELYDNYNKLYRLATIPDGSYNSFNDDYSNYTNDLLDSMDRIELQTDIYDLPEK